MDTLYLIFLNFDDSISQVLDTSLATHIANGSLRRLNCRIRISYIIRAAGEFRFQNFGPQNCKLILININIIVIKFKSLLLFYLLLLIHRKKFD